jgi:hypothetical protein
VQEHKRFAAARLQVRVTPQAVRDKPGVSNTIDLDSMVGNRVGRNTGYELKKHLALLITI